MAAINFPTATSNGQTFTADTGVIYTYIGTPPNGFWSGTFGTTGLATLDGRFVALNDGNSIQTMQTQGLKFNNGSADTILLDGVNGNVGIGTASPASTGANYGSLDINGSAGGEIYLSDSGTAKGNLFNYSADSNLIGLAAVNASGQLVFSTGGYTERMRIDSSGKVGIGTTSPSHGLLTLAQSASSFLNALVIQQGNTGFTSSDGLHIGISTGVDAYMMHKENRAIFFGTADTERMRIDSSGTLVIGRSTSSDPNRYVQIHNGSAASSSYFQSTNTGTGSGATDGIIMGMGDATNAYFWNYEAGTLIFATNNTERMRIDSSGRLLVGTATSNGAKFKVSDGGAHEFAFYPNDAGVNSLVNYNRSGAAYIDMSIAAREVSFLTGTSPAEAVRIDRDRRLLIGTNTAATNAEITLRATAPQLSLFATPGNVSRITLGDTDDWNIGQIGYDNSDNSMFFSTNNATQMLIDSSGNVGIGTTSPDAPLQIGVVEYPGTKRAALQVKTQSNTVAVGEAAIYIEEASGGEGYSLGVDSSGGLELNSSSSATPTLYLGDDDNVGFGTNSFHLTTSGRKTLALDGNSETAIGFQHSGTLAAFLYTSSDEFRIQSELAIPLVFRANNSEAMRIQTSGNLCIGTTTNLSSKINIAVPSLTNRGKWSDCAIAIGNTTVLNSYSQIGLGYFNVGSYAPTYFGFISTSQSGFGKGALVFGTRDATTDSQATERMRLTESGNFLIGTDNTFNATDSSNPSGNFFGWINGRLNIQASGEGIAIKRHSSNGSVMQFSRGGTGPVGSISVNGSATAFNTSSDYRLKENVVDLTAAIPRLKTLPVHRFNFIADSETTVDGFLAHEAQLVVPEAVTGTHNEVDGDGNPVMQGIDQAKLVPLLTAALQEAIGRIETLETEVAALKGG